MVNRLCIPPLLQVPPASRGEPFGSFAPLPPPLRERNRLGLLPPS
jgi:hypothetical protein